MRWPGTEFALSPVLGLRARLERVEDLGRLVAQVPLVQRVGGGSMARNPSTWNRWVTIMSQRRPRRAAAAQPGPVRVVPDLRPALARPRCVAVRGGLVRWGRG